VLQSGWWWCGKGYLRIVRVPSLASLARDDNAALMGREMLGAAENAEQKVSVCRRALL